MQHAAICENIAAFINNNDFAIPDDRLIPEDPNAKLNISCGVNGYHVSHKVNADQRYPFSIYIAALCGTNCVSSSDVGHVVCIFMSRVCCTIKSDRPLLGKG